MRTHGWGGTPPASDDEARTRIIRAAIACVDEHGGGADVGKVAERLQVTRQTVYRDFPSRRVRLLQALSLDPSTASRRDDDLRRFLAACLRPSVHPSGHPSTIRK